MFIYDFFWISSGFLPEDCGGWWIERLQTLWECISLGGANGELGTNPRDEWISVEMIPTYSAGSGLDDPPTLQIGDWVIPTLPAWRVGSVGWYTSQEHFSACNPLLLNNALRHPAPLVLVLVLVLCWWHNRGWSSALQSSAEKWSLHFFTSSKSLCFISFWDIFLLLVHKVQSIAVLLSTVQVYCRQRQ